MDDKAGIKMTVNLEDLLARLGRQPGEDKLLGLEARVWASIRAQQRLPSLAAIWGWRSAAAAAIMTLGILLQAASVAKTPSELSLFSSRPALAPSTLLGESQ